MAERVFPGQLPLAPEFLIVPMLILLPVAFLYVGYKLVRGSRAFVEGLDEA